MRSHLKEDRKLATDTFGNLNYILMLQGNLNLKIERICLLTLLLPGYVGGLPWAGGYPGSLYGGGWAIILRTSPEKAQESTKSKSTPSKSLSKIAMSSVYRDPLWFHNQKPDK